MQLTELDQPLDRFRIAGDLVMLPPGQPLSHCAHGSPEEGPVEGHPTFRPPWRPQRRLSDIEVVPLVQSYEAGATVNELVERFEVSRQTITSWLTRRGVARRRRGLTAEQAQQAAKLYGEGWSLRRIGQTLGAADATVWKALRQADIALRRPWERPP